jgi:hypothetical protein
VLAIKRVTLLVVLFSAAILSATLLYADNKPWKTKPYQQWDDKDIQSIMAESPWVQITAIERSWLPVSEKDVPPEQQIAGGVRHASDSAGANGGTTAGNPAATSRASESSQRGLNVYVYWDSSRVMRAAQARQRVLHGEMKDSEVDAYMRQPEDEYVLVLSMGDMTPFIKNDEKFFQANSSLEMKKGKLSLPPSHVAYQKDAGGILQQVTFFFPKKNASGAPTIGSDKTDVEFRCRIAATNLKVGFSPKKMTDQTGPDL